MSTLVYYTSWSMYARGHTPGFVPEGVDNLAYAFWQWDNEAKVVKGHDDWADSQILPALQATKRSRPNMKIQLSIFGWTLSQNASDAFLPENIDKFIASLRSIDAQYPGLFDGWSIDWEYPTDDGSNYGNTGNIARPEDAKNFLDGLRKIKAAFPNKILSIAMVAVPTRMKFDVKAVSETIDEIHLMTYDFHASNFADPKKPSDSGGNFNSGHQTNPYPSTKWTFADTGESLSCEGAAKHVVSLGVEPKKVYIGGVCYSRGFPESGGLGQPNGGLGDTVPIKGLTLEADNGGYWERGIADYKVQPLVDHQEMVDPETKGAYSYSAIDRTLHTYDNPESIKHKTDIVKNLGLGGIIFWELSGDDLDNKDRSVIFTSLKHLANGVPPANPQVPVQPPSNPQVPVQPPSNPQVPVQPPANPQVPSVPNPEDKIVLYDGDIFIDNIGYEGKIYCLKGGPILYADVRGYGLPDRKCCTKKDYQPVQPPQQPSVPVQPPSVPQVPVQPPSVPQVPVQPPQQPSVPVQPPTRAPSWSEGVKYRTGDMVTYLGSKYECVQGHSSITGWNPSIVAALWRKV